MAAGPLTLTVPSPAARPSPGPPPHSALIGLHMGREEKEPPGLPRGTCLVHPQHPQTCPQPLHPPPPGPCPHLAKDGVEEGRVSLGGGGVRIPGPLLAVLPPVPAVPGLSSGAAAAGGATLLGGLGGALAPLLPLPLPRGLCVLGGPLVPPRAWHGAGGWSGGRRWEAGLGGGRPLRRRQGNPLTCPTPPAPGRAKPISGDYGGRKRAVPPRPRARARPRGHGTPGHHPGPQHSGGVPSTHVPRPPPASLCLP